MTVKLQPAARGTARRTSCPWDCRRYTEGTSRRAFTERQNPDVEIVQQAHRRATIERGAGCFDPGLFIEGAECLEDLPDLVQ